MKINKLSVIAGLALGSLVATGNMAMAQDQKGGGQRRGPSVEQRMEKMTEDLKLTDEQKPKVKAILEETQKKREELSGVPREERREKARGIVEKENKKLKEVLTADQYTKREKMQEELRSSAKGGKNRKNGQDGQEKKE